MTEDERTHWSVEERSNGWYVAKRVIGREGVWRYGPKESWESAEALKEKMKLQHIIKN